MTTGITAAQHAFDTIVKLEYNDEDNEVIIALSVCVAYIIQKLEDAEDEMAYNEIHQQSEKNPARIRGIIKNVQQDIQVALELTSEINKYYEDINSK